LTGPRCDPSATTAGHPTSSWTCRRTAPSSTGGTRAPPSAPRAFGNPPDSNDPNHCMTDAWHRAEIPAANMDGNARSLDRLFALLACGRHRADVELLPSLVAEFGRRQVSGEDKVMELPTAFALGFAHTIPEWPFGPGAHTSGHNGSRGSLAIVDPDTGVSLGYAMNRLWWARSVQTPGGRRSSRPCTERSNHRRRRPRRRLGLRHRGRPPVPGALDQSSMPLNRRVVTLRSSAVVIGAGAGPASRPHLRSRVRTPSRRSASRTTLRAARSAGPVAKT